MVHNCRISNVNGKMDSLSEDTPEISKMLPDYTF